MINVPIENGVYSCEYSFESQTSSDCSHLNNFIFNTNDGMFSWTPDYSQSGIYNIVITSPTGKKNKFLIEVAKKNAAPEISVVSSPAQYLENSSYQIELDALDANHDSLSYSYECLSANCHQIRNISLNQSTKIFSFDTDYNSEGSYSILFRVNDGQLSDSINVTFNVLNVNRAPVVSTINAVTISENQSWFTNIIASDLDGDELNYSCINCPSGMSVHPTSGLMSWQPSGSQSGNYSVEIGATDGSLLTSMTFSMNVTNVNAAPVLAFIGNKSVNENSLLTFNLLATDPDGESVTYSCGATCPSGMTITGATVSWTPTYSQSGSFAVTFSVSDGALSDTENITITVNNINRAPVLAAVGNKSANENSLLTFNF